MDHPECCRRSFASFLKDTARRLLEDPSFAPPKVAKQRLEICESCDRYQAESMQCTICQCIMPVKTTMANMKCPVDKWLEYKRGNENEN